MAVALVLGCALAAGQQRRPNLHGGGAKPSEIPNHETTTVTLPGFHLSGAKVTLDGPCRLASYEVVSDNEIRMQIQGALTIDDAESQCGIHVKTAAGSAATWIVVALTDDEQRQKEAKQVERNRAKAMAMLARSGRRWDIRFADGAADTYNSKGMDPDGMPLFLNRAGQEVKLAVRDDNTVFIIEDRCVRGGTLLDGQVKNGTSMEGCPHPGTWTATVQ